MNDNYHQPVMGGTGPNSVQLGFADQVFYSDGKGNVATPPAGSIYNPDPRPGTLNYYTARRAMVQLLRSRSARDLRHIGLFEAVALRCSDEMRSRRLLQRGEHQSGLDAARHADGGDGQFRR